MNTYKKINLQLLSIKNISNQNDDQSSKSLSSERQNTIIKNINNNKYNNTINQINKTLNVFNNINTLNNKNCTTNNDFSFSYIEKLSTNNKLKKRNLYLINLLKSIENSNLTPKKINGNPYNNYHNNNYLYYNSLLKQNKDLLLENNLLKKEYYNNLKSKNRFDNLINNKEEIESKINSLNYSFNNFLKLLSVNNIRNTPITKQNSNENLIFTKEGNLNNNNNLSENSSSEEDQIEISLKPFEKKIPPKSANNKMKLNTLTKNSECYNRFDRNDIKSLCMNTLKNSKQNIFIGKKNNLLYSINNNVNKTEKVLMDEKNNNLKNDKFYIRSRAQNNTHYNYNNYNYNYYKSNGGISKKFNEFFKSK